jgi:hypothetical protein
MTFTGSFTAPKSIWYRSEVRKARLNVDRDTVEMAGVNPFGPVRHPCAWKIPTK